MVQKYLLQVKFHDGIERLRTELYTDEKGDAVKLLLRKEDRCIEVTDESTEMALLQLSALLGNHCEIQSCFTCRYGNFCPIGDQDNEIFCIKDI